MVVCCFDQILVNVAAHRTHLTRVVVVVVIRVMHLGLADRSFVPQIGIVPSFISRGTLHHAAREASISEGRKLNIRILRAAHNEPQLLGSFTWDRLFDFPSKGRHAEKNPTASAGSEPANSRTRGQHANH
jgi:hypothetical protein